MGYRIPKMPGLGRFVPMFHTDRMTAYEAISNLEVMSGMKVRDMAEAMEAVLADRAFLRAVRKKLIPYRGDRTDGDGIPESWRMLGNPAHVVSEEWFCIRDGEIIRKGLEGGDDDDGDE